MREILAINENKAIKLAQLKAQKTNRLKSIPLSPSNEIIITITIAAPID